MVSISFLRSSIIITFRYHALILLSMHELFDCISLRGYYL